MEDRMKSARQPSAGAKKTVEDRTGIPPLPHETDQAPDSQKDVPRSVGKQAHRDISRGLEDTDRRGGVEYQKRTQNNAQAHANANSKEKLKTRQ
jgi:hypothetical protein